MKLLKIQTLDKGWHDRDEILLHACFQVLVDFVEQEKPDQILDWSHSDESRRVWKEIMSLYRWWKEKRPARTSPLDDKKLRHPPFRFKKIPGADLSELVEPDRRKYAAYYRALKKDAALEEKWLREDQRNLQRLIEIRPHLWT
ncbi:MAG: hypothetical protein HY741_04620 [Chloroflexi bacterium]|nr:hypothetical protein [Chloroflexota bacterium]